MPIYKNKDYIRIMRPLPDYIHRDIFDIPFIEADDIDISGLNNSQWLINMKNANASDKHADRKIVHSFCYVRQLETISRILANEFTEHRRNIVFRRCCVMSSRGSKVVNGQEITPQINQMPDICFLSTLSPPENAALFIGN
ncbi:MAG: hypothetical protein II395_10465 [Ruminococcus sp.]|nr:hypothetical protein [Ruminococcus sp.]MBQ5628601.1 hypothetical protein [Ruminococcus sp.]